MKHGTTLVGWAVGQALFWGLAQLIPPTTCRDGWRSPSIGRSGACSHHGGVDRSGSLLALLALGVSVWAGFWISGRLQTAQRDRKLRAWRAGLVVPAPDAPTREVLAYAIHAGVDVELLYKAPEDFEPRLRRVTPTGWRDVRVPSRRRRHPSEVEPAITGASHPDLERASFALSRIHRATLLLPAATPPRAGSDS